MKKWWCAVLAVTLCATGCMGPKPPKDKILVEFWDFPRLPSVQIWMENAIDEFERQNPDIHVEYTRLSWAKGGERMDIAAFAGRPPDLAGAVLNLKYAEAGVLEPVDKYLDAPAPELDNKTFREDIYPSMLRDVQWGDTTWAFPWYKEGFVILLNKEIFEERGVELPTNGQWEWDEFLEKMHQLTFDRDGDQKTDVYGIGFSTGKEKWEAYSFLFAEGMQIMSADGRTMLTDSEATRRGVNRLRQMEFKEKVALPGAGGIQDDTTWSAFSGPERRLAATCQGLWSINAVKFSNERVAKLREEAADPGSVPKPLHIAVALYPKMPGQPQVMASYGVGSLMVFKRPTAPERTDAAARLARFLTLEAGQKINREAGLYPSRISTGNLYEDHPLYKDIAPFIPDAISPPTHPAWSRVTTVIGQYLQLMLLRREGVDDGVSEMTKRCQMILDDFWEAQAAEED